MIKNKFYIGLFGIFLLFLVLSLLQNRVEYDEKYFHLPTLILFFKNGIFKSIVSPNYNAANTPLPYIISILPIKLLGLEPDLSIARIINSLIACFTIIVFIVLLKRRGNKTTVIYGSLILFFYPYFLKPAFTYYMAVYGLLFFLLSLLFIDDNSYKGSLLTGFFTAFAILSQQFYLLLILFYPIHLFIYDSFKVSKEYVLKVSLFLLPQLIPFIIFYVWNGFTPHKFSYHNIQFEVTNISAIIIIIGSVVLPFFIFGIKQINIKTSLTASILGLLLVIFFMPGWQNAPAAGKISGYTFHSAALLQNIFVPAGFIVKCMLAFIGIIAFYFLYKRINNKSDFLLFSLILLFSVGFVFNTLLSERHVLPLIALLYLFLIPKISEKKILRFWVSTQVVLGSVYFYYWLYIAPVH